MPKKISFYSPTNQYVILTRLLRYGQCLSNAEFKVLMFIYDRTIGYKKLVESIPYRHFIEGVVGRDGKRWTYGCGLGETALKRALRGLVAKEIIVRARRDNSYCGTFYAINVEWQTDDIEQMWRPEVSDPEE